MLTEMDDTLWHQLPTTFDHVYTSDPRFYDRYWFSAVNLANGSSLQLTMGAYTNMDVMDSACSVVIGHLQHNVRASRSLRPDFTTHCGPIKVSCLRPLSAFEVSIGEGKHAISGELHWQASTAASEELPHFSRSRGRVREEARRFNQIGLLRGWLLIDDTHVDVSDWWSCRDHSWGVRPGMGVPEPKSAPNVPLSSVGFFMAFLFFSTEQLSGTIHLSERGEGRLYTSVDISPNGNAAADAPQATRVEVRPIFFPGTRRFQECDFTIEFVDGSSANVKCHAAGPSTAMTGLGYSGGFRDGRGLGAWRGADHVEWDRWNVSHPVDVIDDAGSVARPWHRIQPVGVSVAGAGLSSDGIGSLTMIASGNLPQYGLAST